MSKRPTYFWTTPDYTYVNLGDYHISRYDFADENAPIYLVHGDSQEFAVINGYKLHMLARYANDVATGDDAQALAALDRYNDACAEFVRRYRERCALLAQEEAAREDEYESEHIRQESRADLFI